MAKYAFRTHLPEPIVGERVVLRVPTLEDVPALAALANNKAVHKWLARLPHPYTEEDARKFISEMVRSDREHGFAITLDGTTLIGLTSLMFHGGLPEIGYWLGEPYWGRGLMTESVSAMMRAAARAGARRIRARIKRGNRGSRRVLEKTGFRHIEDRMGIVAPDAGIAMSYFVWEGGRDAG